MYIHDLKWWIIILEMQLAKIQLPKSTKNKSMGLDVVVSISYKKGSNQ